MYEDWDKYICTQIVNIPLLVRKPGCRTKEGDQIWMIFIKINLENRIQIRKWHGIYYYILWFVLCVVTYSFTAQLSWLENEISMKGDCKKISTCTLRFIQRIIFRWCVFIFSQKFQMTTKCTAWHIASGFLTMFLLEIFESSKIFGHPLSYCLSISLSIANKWSSLILFVEDWRSL